MMKCARTGSAGAVVIAAAMLAGCAPRDFGPAVDYASDRQGARDAAVRRTTGYWYLSFNSFIASDLDDVIQVCGREDDQRAHERATVVLRAANSLDVDSAASEIARLTGPARAELASLAGVPPDAKDLSLAYSQRSRQAFAQLAEELDRLPVAQLKDRLRRIRNSIEPAPDDRGRVVRQLALAWGAAPAWLGVAQVDKKLEQKREHEADAAFANGVAWLPADKNDGSQLARFMPVIIIEEPAKRSYPPEYDRFGQVYLTGTPADIDVNINTSRPIVYGYTSEAKVGEHRYPQVVYVWWYPHRPAMENDDPAAGHVDGDTLRITMDSSGRPAIFEVMQTCGCGHLVYISEDIEAAALRKYGSTLPDRKLAVQTAHPGMKDLIVMGAIKVPPDDPRPVVYVEAGYHSVARVACTKGFGEATAETLRSQPYDLEDYSNLERLPLGNGIGSMFGPDGLVHKAGRKEGYLLAPTGILSAGQPRKRGTQKIRWDEYSFDDPRLLEKTLRLPDSF